MSELSIRSAAQEAPDRVALVTADSEWTFAELAEAVRRETEMWGDPARSPRARITFTARNDPKTVVRILGAIELGVPFVPLHLRLTESERADLVRAHSPLVDLDDSDAATEAIFQTPTRAADPTPPPNVLSPESPLAILFTSGTTGRPKAARLSRRAFLAAARASQGNLPLSPSDRWLLSMPIAHVGGLSILIRSLIARSTVVLGDRFEPDHLARFSVTLASLVPTQLARWLDRWEPHTAAPKSLRAILLGGGPAPAVLLDRAAKHGLGVLPTFGLTETCSQVATCRSGTPPSSAEGCGRPLPGFEVRVDHGRILIRGPALFSGYEGQPSPFDADGWFDTGDLGRVDDRGRLHVDARREDLILTGGENVYPSEVEQSLEQCPGVSEVCVFGIEDPDWGQLVCAAFVGDTTREALAAFTANRLAPFKRPRIFARVDSLPRTASGKVDRTTLRERTRPRRDGPWPTRKSGRPPIDSRAERWWPEDS